MGHTELKIAREVDPNVLKITPRDAPEDGVYSAVAIVHGERRHDFAEYIVKACNNHYALLEACEQITCELVYLRRLLPKANSEVKYYLSAIDQWAEDAIAKVKEGQDHELHTRPVG